MKTRLLGLIVTVTLAVAASAARERSERTWPGAEWPEAEPADVGLDGADLERARDYALSAGGSGLVLRRGKVVLRWGDQQKRYDLKSTTKSIGVTALGLALGDGKIKLDAPARRYHPSLGVPPRSNADTGWLDDVTVRHLATQTAGFAKPGGYEKLLFEPGTRWHYSDGGPNWLAECVTLAYRRDVEDLLFERVFGPIGIGRDDLRWRSNAYRPHEIRGVPRREFGSGVHANVGAMARVGYLYLHEGRWRDRQLIPRDFVERARSPVPSVAGLPEHEQGAHGNASDHYGLLWWNNADGALEEVPRDAFWSWGLYDSIILVVPSLDLVAVRAGARGRQWERKQDARHYDVLRPFFEPIVEAADAPGTGRARGNPMPYPRSTLIRSIEWAPREQIVRRAKGSDNWPMTWADDGRLYTAYGDGWGFKPFVPEKLSLGLARVEGMPPDVRGENIRSESAEQRGGGPRGKKASGMLMVGGVLYMLVRNAGNSRLAWSRDHGETWRWCDWQFTAGFGCPTFLNFGRNYAGARDDYVYVYSPDSETAYEPADRMVLARVPADRIRRRGAYEFFVRTDESGRPVWSGDVGDRGPVFRHEGRCYRSGITYCAPLERYLWVQVLPGSRDRRGPRFEGGFGVYAAPEPWGPWRTAFFTEHWDVGPGESARFPTKWMSDDGRTLHLAFSGADHFSVRRARLEIRPGEGE